MTVASTDFEPQDIFRRARARRSTQERFDRFSDGYIWVLAVLILFTYAVSASNAVLYVLQSAAADSVVLPTAVLEVSQALALLFPLLVCGVLDLLRRLGPCSISAAESTWVMTLPQRSRALLRACRRRALGLGAGAMFLTWALWYVALIASGASFDPLTLLGGSVASVLLGTLLAGLAMRAQIVGRRTTLRRTLRWVSLGYLATLGLLWLGSMAGAGHLLALISSRLVDLWAAPGSWLLIGILVLLGALLAVGSTRSGLERISRFELSRSGALQGSLVAALSQLDIRNFAAGLGEERPTGRRRRRGPVARLAPVPQILTLSLWRSARWRPAAVLLATSVLLFLVVRGAANPLMLLLTSLVLVACASFLLGSCARPLISVPGLSRLLGLPQQQIRREVVNGLLAVGAPVVVVWALVAPMLGILPAGTLPWWLVACAALLPGIAAGALGYAGRPMRDWEEMLTVAGNDEAMGLWAMRQLTPLLSALVAVLPVAAVLLGLAPPALLVALVVSLLRSLPPLLGALRT
ncbi:DUF6297 family protein [Glutamicibacter endophyticus]|uniref:DUF6297 family protein n=1 Tax=Glutamicibacter endophyticus TaxID=1522174 RepID=UPI003AEF9899